MSQQVWSTINPDTTSGTMLAAILTDFKDALMTGLAGTSRPSQLQAGGMWIDTSQQAPPNYYWIFRLWTGTEDVEIFRLNINSGFGGALTAEALFEVRQISADTIGAIQDLVKQRVANNGQLLTGDTVGEIQFVGRTNAGLDTTVAYMKWVATDDQGAAQHGGTLSFYSTPDASSVIAEHLRFISGLVETPVPLVINAMQPVAQEIATATTIVQLSATKSFVEFTGSTGTSVQGINSAQDAKEIILHNKSTAIVVLKHENTSAAAADRIDLPGNQDFSIEPDGTLTLFYSSAQSRWKIKSSYRLEVEDAVTEFTGVFNQWTAPEGVTRINLSARKITNKLCNQGFVDRFGNAYFYGFNSHGQLGLGDVNPRSSPVAVLGGVLFSNVQHSNERSLGLDTQGNAYGWGGNLNGELGVGDTTDRSSPVAVVGGLKFSNLLTFRNTAFGITTSGKLYTWGFGNNFNGIGAGDEESPVEVVVGGGLSIKSIEGDHGIHSINSALCITGDGAVYSWGENGSGQLGLGDTTNRATPTVISDLSSLKFKKVLMLAGSNTVASSYALTDDGDLYAWGYNGNGQLGLGDTTDRSSPVAIAGFKFKNLWVIREGTVALGSGGSVIAQGEDGNYYGWGKNTSGSLGAGDITPRSSPVLVLTGITHADIEEITGSNAHTIIRMKDGKLYSCGANSSGELGLGDTNPRSSPVLIAGGIEFASVFDEGLTTVKAMDKRGQVYGWGLQISFAPSIGDGSIVSKSTPTLVVGAFGAESSQDYYSISIDVVPEQTYEIKMGYGMGMFGNIPIGFNLDKVTIDYSERGG